MPHTLFNNTNQSSPKHYRLFLDSLVHEGSDIHEILNTLHNAEDEDTLEVRINSRGGYVMYGHPFINIMKGKFKNRCITIIESDALSMGGLIFMAADTRIIYEHSSLMVHTISGGTYGKAPDAKKQLEAEAHSFEMILRSLYKNVMTEEELSRVLNGIEFWFTAEEMCDRNIATHIITSDKGLMTVAAYRKYKENPGEQERKETEEALAAIKEEYTDVMKEYKEKIEELEKNLALLGKGEPREVLEGN